MDKINEITSECFIALSQLRELGPRNLYTEPPSEVVELITQLNVRGRPLAETTRAVLEAFGLKRMTENAIAYVEECLSYEWTTG